MAFLVVGLFSVHARSAVDVGPQELPLAAVEDTLVNDAENEAKPEEAVLEYDSNGEEVLVGNTTVEEEGNDLILVTRYAFEKDEAYTDPWILYPERNPLKSDSFLVKLYESRRNAKLDGSYFDRSLRFENDLENPFRYETLQDYKMIRDRRNAVLRSWSKDTLKEQARDVVGDADEDSAPISLVRRFGGSFIGKVEDTSNKPKRRELKRRADGSVTYEEYYYEKLNNPPAPARLSLHYEPRKPVVAERTPVKVKTRLNVAKRQTKLILQNPILETGAAIDMRSDDRLEAQVNREFKSIGFSSGVSYGFEMKTLTMQIRQRITDEITCEARSFKSERKDVIQERQVRMNYQIGF